METVSVERQQPNNHTVQRHLLVVVVYYSSNSIRSSVGGTCMDMCTFSCVSLRQVLKSRTLISRRGLVSVYLTSLHSRLSPFSPYSLILSSPVGPVGTLFELLGSVPLYYFSFTLLLLYFSSTIASVSLSFGIRLGCLGNALYLGRAHFGRWSQIWDAHSNGLNLLHLFKFFFLIYFFLPGEIKK